MKRFFFLLLAAVLLSSVNAFAQSGNNEPLKGDVNGDGKVDVADIAAIIQIMKKGGGTSGEKNNYYVGTTDKINFTEADFNQSGEKPTSISFDGAYGDFYHTFIFPSSWGKPFFKTMGLEYNGWYWNDSYCTWPDGYNLLQAQGGSVTMEVIWPDEETTYYTYIGPDLSYKIVDANDNLTSNAASNLPTMSGIVTSTTMPQSINDAYPVGTTITPIDGISPDYVYIIALSSLFNKSDNSKYFKSMNDNDIAMVEMGTFYIGTNTYKVLSTRDKVSSVIVQ